MSSRGLAVEIGYNANTKTGMKKRLAIGKRGEILNLTKAAMQTDMIVKTRDIIVKNVKERVKDKPKPDDQVGRLREGDGWKMTGVVPSSKVNNPEFVMRVEPKAYVKRNGKNVIYAEWLNYGHYKARSKKAFGTTNKKRSASEHSGSTWIPGIHFVEAANEELKTRMPAVLAGSINKDLEYYMKE